MRIRNKNKKKKEERKRWYSITSIDTLREGIKRKVYRKKRQKGARRD